MLLTALVEGELVKAAPRRFLPDIFVGLVRAQVAHSQGVVEGFTGRLKTEVHSRVPETVSVA